MEAKDNREVVDIAQLNAELKNTVARIDVLRAEIDAIVAEIGGRDSQSMNESNFLEKLLDGIEVDWVALGDERFIEISNSGRKPVEASLRVSGTTPYYGANNIQDYVDGYTHDGNFVLIAEDGSASLERYSIQYATGKFWANNHVHVVRGKHGLNTRYLYHYLATVNFNPFLTGGGRAKLTKGSMIESQSRSHAL